MGSERKYTSVIRQANELIDQKGRMTVDEQRLFYSILKEIQHADTDFHTMRLPVRQICEEWDINGKNAYRSIKRAMDLLSERSIKFHYTREDESKAYKVITLLASAEYLEGKGIVEVRIHDDMKPFLLQLSKNYTQFEFDQIRRLSSAGMAFYEIFKRFSWVKVWTCTPSDIKRAVGLEETQYPAVSDLERKVLKLAIEEINAKTTMEVSYQKNGRGEETTFAIRIKLKNADGKEARKKGEIRNRYGASNNVLLSDSEMEKLKKEFPLDWEDRIERLSEYMASRGKTYIDHLATIRSWARKDRKETEVDKTKPYYGPNGVLIDPTMDDLKGYF